MTQTVAAPTAANADRRTRPEWHGSAVAAFREVAAAHPDRDAVIAEDGRLSYAQLDERSDRLAGILTGRGLARSAPSACCSPAPSICWWRSSAF